MRERKKQKTLRSYVAKNLNRKKKETVVWFDIPGESTNGNYGKLNTESRILMKKLLLQRAFGIGCDIGSVF